MFYIEHKMFECCDLRNIFCNVLSMPQNFELQTICVILMVNENWFHSNIGCGAEFNLFAGFVYLTVKRTIRASFPLPI